MQTRPIPTIDGRLKPEFLQAVLGIVLASHKISRGDLLDILKRSGWQPINGEVTAAIRELMREGLIFARFPENAPYIDSSGVLLFDTGQDHKYYNPVS